jgi:hypothetical protein
MDDQTYQAQQHKRRRLGDRCPATGASEIAKPVALRSEREALLSSGIGGFLPDSSFPRVSAMFPQ